MFFPVQNLIIGDLSTATVNPLAPALAPLQLEAQNTWWFPLLPGHVAAVVVVAAPA